MDNKNDNTKAKIAWFTKYWYLMLFVVGVLAFIITIIAVGSNGEKANNNVEPANANALTFYLPLTDATITKNYNDKALQYNATLNQWEVHKAIDFGVAAGADVCAVCSGKVVDIYNTYLDGTVVVIEHANNLKTKYASLDSELNVAVGDNVTGGQVIGRVANSAKGEASEGAHLHFEMLENDKKIDPSAYLNLENK